MKKKVEEELEVPHPESWEEMEMVEALHESNLIERELSEEALEDAVLAWSFAYKNRHHIDLDYILEIHRLLCQRIAPEIAGKIRDCDVWIGGEFKPFISEGLIKADLKEWLKNSKVNSRRKGQRVTSKEDLVKKWHVGFEKVHPFVDFNGRTGRILYYIQRALLDLPLKIIKSETKFEEYYPWFKES